MKASIKLVTTEKQNNKGYPVYVFVKDRGKRKKKCIFRSFETDWDALTLQPLKTHPDFFNVMPLVLDYKAKIAKINYGKHTFAEALNYLFEDAPGRTTANTFYAAGQKLVNKTTNGKLYNTVLNSFNAVYPNINTGAITQDHAKKYMAECLKSQSANGVHTYMRTLAAIFKKVSALPDPFLGVRPRKQKTKNKALTLADVKVITGHCALKSKFDGQNTNLTVNYPRFYWQLMFYLGGIDFIDLAALRYDRHEINGRIQFARNKGGTSEFVNNIIPPQAWRLLKLFNCYPYFVPIYKYADYNGYLSRCNSRLVKQTEPFNLSRPPLTKSARYTFINRAQQLLIDQRITMEIVGHSQNSTHGIYTDSFPEAVRDQAHLKIIEV